MLRIAFILVGIVLLGLGLVACAEESTAPDVIEDYIKAKVASDSDKLVELSCSDWEAGALQDALSYASVNAEVESLSCQEAGSEGDFTLVTCSGEVAVEYDGETRNQDLGGTTYRALKEDGDWKMCGQQ